MRPKRRNPSSMRPRAENFEAFGKLANEYACPLAVKAQGLEALSDLSDKLIAMGVKDMVLDSGSRSMKEAFSDQIVIRRAALQSRVKPLGFPTIALPCEMTDDFMKETLIASLFIAKYAGLIVLSDFKGENLFPLLLERLNIYTDPQRPMTTSQGIYPLNNPDENSPVLVTCNFLSYLLHRHR